MEHIKVIIPVGDLPEFQEIAPKAKTTIVSVKRGDDNLCLVELLSEGLSMIYLIGRTVGYGQAFREAKPVMDKALSQMNEIKDRFNELVSVNDELNQLTQSKNDQHE